jgi:hypothetical protein
LCHGTSYTKEQANRDKYNTNSTIHTNAISFFERPIFLGKTTLNGLEFKAIAGICCKIREKYPKSLSYKAQAVDSFCKKFVLAALSLLVSLSII